MGRPYFAAHPAWWPTVADGLSKPWDREAVLMDLAWWENEARIERRRFPGARSLARRWGWTHWAARQVVKDSTAWRDPLHLEGGAPHSRRTPPAHLPHTSRTPTTSKVPESAEGAAQSPHTSRTPPAQEPPHAESRTREPENQRTRDTPPTPPGGTVGEPATRTSKPRKTRKRKAPTADRKLVEEVWAALMLIRKGAQGGRGLGLESLFESSTIRVQLGRRLAEGAKVGLTPADGLAALVWTYTSRTINAKGARKTGDPVKALIRRRHWVDYCQRADLESVSLDEDLLAELDAAELGHLVPGHARFTAAQDEAPVEDLGPALPMEALRRANGATQALVDAASNHVPVDPEGLDLWVGSVLDTTLADLGGLAAVEELLQELDYHAARARVFRVASGFALADVLEEESRGEGAAAK